MYHKEHGAHGDFFNSHERAHEEIKEKKENFIISFYSFVSLCDFLFFCFFVRFFCLILCEGSNFRVGTALLGSNFMV